MLCKFLTCLLISDSSFLFAINLIADDPYADIFSSVFLDVVEPHVDIMKGVQVGHIIHQKDRMRIPQVPRDETSESLLACRVPELQADGPVGDDYIFGKKIDADGGLNDKWATLWVESN